MGGIIIDESEYKPFLMYINGLKCQPMWKFGREASEYTRSGIPMFALTVKLTTTQVKSDFGMKWVPVFEIVKENGSPILVLDMETFTMLKNGVVKLERDIVSLIEAKASEEEGQVLPSIQEEEPPLPTE
jgi:hypothetical protein